MNKLTKRKSNSTTGKLKGAVSMSRLSADIDKLPSFIFNHNERFEKITNDLRDGINQKLYAVKLKLENAIFKLNRSRLHKSVNKEILQANEFLSEVITGIRQLSVDFDPSAGYDGNLKQSILELCNKYSNRGGKTFLLTLYDIPENIHKPAAHTIYNFIYEIFWYAYHYSFVNVLTVELKLIDKSVQISVKGDGKNLFSEKNQVTGDETLQKMGLLCILQRVCVLNGYVNLTQRKGTTINITIPIYETKENTTGRAKKER